MKTSVRVLAALLLSLVVCIPVLAQEIVHAVALPRATMSELAARPWRDRPRTIVHRILPRLSAFAGASRHDALSSLVGAVEAPPATTVFDADTSRNLTPPDASGAVGPAHVLTVSNARIIVHDRAGNVLTFLGQTQFWSASAPLGSYYDPRAAYDAAADRWVMMAVHDETDLMVAVSETGDPGGAWARYRLAASDPDFSMLAITAETVIFGTIEFWSLNSELLSARKEDLYAMPTSVPMTRYLEEAFTLPVTSDAALERTVRWGAAGLEVRRLGHAGYRTISEPASWARANPIVPQLGTAMMLDAGFNDIQNAVERHGRIYLTMAVDTPGFRSTIGWCRLDPETGEADWGVLEDPQGRSFAYPSLAVNRHGSMLIGFGHFSPNQYASSGYIYRDFLGRVSTVTTIRDGNSAVTFNDRWGDYTTTVVDPVDDTSFWTTQIHAKDGTWATSWAKIEISGGRRRTVRH